MVSPLPHSAHDPVSGTPSWVDVSTRDLDASKEFYAELFGWEFETEHHPAIGQYTFALLDGQPVAGLHALPNRLSDYPTWSLYLRIRRIEAASARVRRLGGRVHYGPLDIQDHGSLLMLDDPSGARVGFWQPTRPWRFVTRRPGTFGWADLNTHLAHRADSFFATLFAFTPRQVGDGKRFDYTTWWLRGKPYLGRLAMGRDYPPEVPPHWMIYFNVSPRVGTDVTADRALMLDGAIEVDPFDSPYGRTAVLRDPGGATFSVIDPSRRAIVRYYDERFDDD
ncbi:VOC family protein [Allokutzneria oryzae]|uniref:VOC family protein n=1 Tax=Allokutzneria oryzae TaxID=1378989 RepID=A0ABV6A4R8_9PSEU